MQALLQLLILGQVGLNKDDALDFPVFFDQTAAVK